MITQVVIMSMRLTAPAASPAIVATARWFEGGLSFESTVSDSGNNGGADGGGGGGEGFGEDGDGVGGSSGLCCCGGEGWGDDGRGGGGGASGGGVFGGALVSTYAARVGAVTASPRKLGTMAIRVLDILLALTLPA